MSADKKKKSVKIICENQRRIRVISVLIFIRIGELSLVSTALKKLVNQETGRPIDRGVSESGWFNGLRGQEARRAADRAVCATWTHPAMTHSSSLSSTRSTSS